MALGGSGGGNLSLPDVRAYVGWNRLNVFKLQDNTKLYSFNSQYAPITAGYNGKNFCLSQFMEQ